MPALILTCEHATNRIPARYEPAFRGARRALAGHAGWDAGALPVARQFAAHTGAPLYAGRVSRLLIDLNRSPRHPQLYSQHALRLPETERQRIYSLYYTRFRDSVIAEAEQRIGSGALLHLSVHSFTPQLAGRRRNADIGLLYDPARAPERALAIAWQRHLRTREPALAIRRNYPYRGVDDGFVQSLRRRWPAERYLGLELEINQRWVGRGGEWAALLRLLVQSFVQLGEPWLRSE